MPVLIVLLCLLIIGAGIIVGWWSPIHSWFQGGTSQVDVNPELRGLHRHSIEYVREHGGRVRRPLRTSRGSVFLVGLRRAELRWSA